MNNKICIVKLTLISPKTVQFRQFAYIKMNNGDVMFWLLAVNKFQEIKLIVKQMITVLLRL